MANEITATASLLASKNGASVQFQLSRRNDMTGNVMSQNVQTIGTSTEQIAFAADLSGIPAWVGLLNLDPTNFVEIGLNTPVTQIFAKLKPGQFALFPAGVATYYAKADTAAVNLQVTAVML
jgi:hypothetical protein